jgi:hypothetical protein
MRYLCDGPPGAARRDGRHRSRGGGREDGAVRRTLASPMASHLGVTPGVAPWRHPWRRTLASHMASHLGVTHGVAAWRHTWRRSLASHLGVTSLLRRIAASCPCRYRSTCEAPLGSDRAGRRYWRFSHDQRRLWVETPPLDQVASDENPSASSYVLGERLPSSPKRAPLRGTSPRAAGARAALQHLCARGVGAGLSHIGPRRGYAPQHSIA